jgi:hypothetical protein
VTQDGLAEFAYLMGTYDQYSPISEDIVGNLPMCESGSDGYYLSVGCAADGSFTIDEFSDQYCLERVKTYTYLSDINNIFKNYFHQCYKIYSSKSDASVAYSAAGALVSGSKSCTALDNALCQNTERITLQAKSIGAISSVGTFANFNFANRAKYTLGSLCLVGSLFMFLGILFTNRRKRRAMMHRKMRASRSRRSSSRRPSSMGRDSQSRSKSRGRGESDGRSRSGARSKSRVRSSSEKARSSSSKKKVEDAVFA